MVKYYFIETKEGNIIEVTKYDPSRHIMYRSFEQAIATWKKLYPDTSLGVVEGKQYFYRDIRNSWTEEWD